MRQAESAELVAAADAELSRCIIALLMKEPFFGHLLGNVVRVFSDPGCDTLAVSHRDGRFVLMVNPGYFLNAFESRSQRVAVVKHEALHIVFRHVFRPPRPDQHAEIYAVACELVVNQFIGAHWDLPPSAVTLKTFAGLALQPDQTVDHYYERLVESLPPASSAGAPSSGEREGHAEDRRGAAATPAGGGGGAGGSNPLPAALAGSHSDHSGWRPPEAGVDTPSSSGSGGRGRSGQAPTVGPPQGSGDSNSNLNDATRQALEGSLDHLVARARARTSDAAFGKLPGRLRQAIDAQVRKTRPRIAWRRALRIFAASSRRTRIAATLRRESRRYQQIPGIKVKRFQKLAVAVDTSGSVGADELATIFNEVHGLWRAGAEVEVIECDAGVQRAWPYRGRPPRDVEGRGGTAFDPVFRYLREQRGVRYDGCIYVTDGHGPTPKVKPPCKLLWLVTPGGTVESLTFGRVLRM